MRTTIVEKRARYKTIDWYLLQNLMSLMYFAMTLEHLFFDFLEATEKYMSPWCRVAHRNTQCSSVNVIWYMGPSLCIFFPLWSIACAASCWSTHPTANVYHPNCLHGALFIITVGSSWRYMGINNASWLLSLAWKRGEVGGANDSNHNRMKQQEQQMSLIGSDHFINNQPNENINTCPYIFYISQFMPWWYQCIA